jgi:hypothetical protein
MRWLDENERTAPPWARLLDRAVCRLKRLVGFGSCPHIAGIGTIRERLWM